MMINRLSTAQNQRRVPFSAAMYGLTLVFLALAGVPTALAQVEPYMKVSVDLELKDLVPNTGEIHVSCSVGAPPTSEQRRLNGEVPTTVGGGEVRFLHPDRPIPEILGRARYETIRVRSFEEDIVQSIEVPIWPNDSSSTAINGWQSGSCRIFLLALGDEFGSLEPADCAADGLRDNQAIQCIAPGTRKEDAMFSFQRSDLK